MFKTTFAALVTLSILGLSSTANAQWDARYDGGTQAVVIESGYLNSDEYVEVRLDIPTGKGISWIVVEHFPSIETRRFRLYPLGSLGKVKLISFLGDDDNDTFINNTDIPSYATGLDGDDYLQGGSKADVLYGSGDNDTLIGNGGADDLFGGDGFDYLNGGAGRDLLDPGDDDFEDDLIGGQGADTFYIRSGQQFADYDLNVAQGDVEFVD